MQTLAPTVSTQSTHFNLPVHGRLPDVLDGVFVRIGPEASTPRLSGEPQMAGLRLREGRADWFRTRWVRTDRVCRVLGELAAPGPRRGLSDCADGGLVRHAGRILAVADAGVLPYELGPDLETRARHDFDGTLPRGFSAHPLHDPLTGELFAAAYYHEPPYVQHLVIDPSGHVRRAEPISVKNASLMHAYSLTEHFAILYDLPVVFDPAAAAAGSRIPYTWDESHGARLGILPREGSDADVDWLEIEPCYVFHPFNAYEDSASRLVLDVVRHERAFDRDRWAPAKTPPMPWRWTVDLAEGRVRAEQTHDMALEFPAVDARIHGSRHQHGFAAAVGSANLPYGASTLIHLDFNTGDTEIHEFGEDHEVGDPVFVPRSADSAEGDGWIMVYDWDRRSDQTRLIVLDTADFPGDPVASVTVPLRGPRGFHSAWLAD